MRSQEAIDLTRLEPFTEYVRDSSSLVTDLTYKLDEGYSYIITNVAVRLKTAIAGGNRNLKFTLRDEANNNFAEHRSSYVQLANLTKDYFWMLNGPEISRDDSITGAAVYIRLPFAVMTGGEEIQINVLIPVGGLDSMTRMVIRGFRCRVDPRQNK